MKKLGWLSMCLFLLLFKPVFTQAVTATEPDMVQITLHKLLFPNGQLPENQPSDGQEKELLQTYRGLNGATFQVYDVTESFYHLREKGKTVEETQTEIAKNGVSSGTFIAEATTETLNNEDGIASFSLPVKDHKKREKAYLFIESKAPEVVKEKAENMVVVLPVYGQNDQELSSIHLYPKNEENNYPDPPFEKVLEESRDDFTIGDKITYSLYTTIPMNILDYQKFVLSDSADGALTFLPNSLTISSNGQKLSEGFVIHTKPHGFEIAFSIPSLEKYAGKNLNISYQMQLNSTAQANKEINNNGTLDFGFGISTKKVSVYTGSKQFVKIETNKPNKRLAGAVFLIKNKAGNYLQRTANGYKWTSNESDALHLTSDKNGAFSIIGLRTGDYWLKELKAPSGYILSETEIPFTISTSLSEDKETVGRLKVVNRKENSRPFLPKTNETKNILLVVVGMVFASLAIWLFIKKRTGVTK